MDTLPETNNAYESTSKPAVGLSVGATLRAAREEQGLKIEDVADRVKFSVRQVEALEADDILHLPQGTFLRGFIRSYARVLHLDETALLEAMQGKTESHLEVTDSQSGGEAFPILDFTRRKNLYLLVGALVVAIVLVVFVWSHRDTPKHEKVVVEDVSLPKVSAVSAPVIALPDVASAVQSTVAPVIPVAPIISVNPKITPTSLPPVAKTTSVNAPVLVKTPVAPIIPVAPVVSVESKKAPTSLPPLAKTASVKALVAPVVSVEPKKKPASLLLAGFWCAVHHGLAGNFNVARAVVAGALAVLDLPMPIAASIRVSNSPASTAAWITCKDVMTSAMLSVSMAFLPSTISKVRAP